MKYILIDQTKTDMFTEEFSNLETAIESAVIEIAHFTKADIKNRTDFFILESCNSDEESENHFDGKVVRRWI